MIGELNVATLSGYQNHTIHLYFDPATPLLGIFPIIYLLTYEMMYEVVDCNSIRLESKYPEH